ncbi:MAG TPA: RodZ domain-containing protein, partial [Thermoanaerobaculia bacterium]|nr:RodZ domain-containing protein [Thermoanaerobaculia bacterium]
TPPAGAASTDTASPDTASPDTLAPTGAATLPLVVTFDFTEKCWLEVQVDGGRRLSRNYVAGESLQIEAERQVTLETVGNVAGVEVQVNGRPYELPTAGSGRTARGVVIDLESAAAPRES